MKLLIRNAEIKDSQSIAELSGQLGYLSNKENIKNRLTEILRNSDNCVLVALENETIIGWVHGFYSPRIESDAFVEIGGLVVDEKYRKNGIGKNLIKQVHNWSDSKKCQKLRVRCNVIRKETHVFYEKLGFKIVKEQKIFDK